MTTPGSHQGGPGDGTLQVLTYREGVAQKVGHDLVIDVERWEATVDVGPDGAIQAVRLSADPRSLRVSEGRNGLKPLRDKDRDDIRGSIDEKVLKGKRIEFASDAVEPQGGGATVRGDLTLAGTSRPASFELSLGEDGRVEGTLPVTQSEWGIKPQGCRRPPGGGRRRAPRPIPV